MKDIFLSVFPLLVFTVVGSSMEPAYKEGEKVLAMKFLPIKKRNVVVVKDPRNGRLLLKRITQIEKNIFFVEGDNQNVSTDSRHFGWIAKKLIVGKVIYPQK